jgi:hypothetical protein
MLIKDLLVPWNFTSSTVRLQAVTRWCCIPGRGQQLAVGSQLLRVGKELFLSEARMLGWVDKGPSTLSKKRSEQRESITSACTVPRQPGKLENGGGTRDWVCSLQLWVEIK